MIPLTKLLVESREDFLAKFWKLSGIGPGELERKQEECVDSLIRKAYLLGLERAKEAVRQFPIPEEVEIRSGDYSEHRSYGRREGVRDTCSLLEEALDSAIGEERV